MYYVYQLCILVLKEGPKVESVLWGPVVQSPLVARGICSVGCMCPPFVVELQLLQTCWWLWLVPGQLASRISFKCCMHAGLQGQSIGESVILEGHWRWLW